MNRRSWLKGIACGVCALLVKWLPKREAKGSLWTVGKGDADWDGPVEVPDADDAVYFVNKGYDHLKLHDRIQRALVRAEELAKQGRQARIEIRCDQRQKSFCYPNPDCFVLCIVYSICLHHWLPGHHVDAEIEDYEDF